MKTEAIRQAAVRCRAQGHFGLASQMDEELAALEESQEEMVKVLRGLLYSAQQGYKLFPSDAQTIEAALRKAGALP